MDAIRVAKVESVVLERHVLAPHASPEALPRKESLRGTLHLTPHHLFFSPDEKGVAEIWVPYPTITLMTRLPQTLAGLYPVRVRTRTWLSFVLLFEKGDGGAEDVWQSVKGCAVVSSVEALYAFFYSASAGQGWNAYNPRQEFTRQGLGTRTKAWRFTDINKDYTFSPTYPAKMVVPSRISDSVLAYAGKYRSKARIPALVYLHWANHASITRSSQPMVGLKNARSAQDERLVECIFSAHLFPDTAHTPSNTLSPLPLASSTPHVYGATTTNLIIDARPTTNAMANVAMGAGTENMDNYKSAKKAYLGIDNIHVMRNSLKVIGEAIREVEENPGATLDRGLLRKSNWLKHISTLLDGSLMIVKNIHLNASHVLIHCSDGWDRTSQLSAIAQICLDPYYRTLDGFAVLVEKEYVSFGHKFLDRSGHLSHETYFTVAEPPDDDSDGEEFGAQKAAQAFFASMQKQFTSNASHSHLKEISPVFHQFLECVRQIQRQFSDRFEFNEDLLLELHEQLYSCRFGTFLFNNERERRSGDKPYVDRTASVWDHIQNQRAKWLNPTFDAKLDDREARTPEADQGVLIFDPKDVKYWHRLFRRGDEEMNGSPHVLAQQAQGAEVIGPVSAGQIDPVSAEGLAVSTSISRDPSPAPPSRDPLSPTSSSSNALFGSPRRSAPIASASTSGPASGVPTNGGWRWSQFSTGAVSALTGAAKEIRSIGQEAYNQIREQNGTTGAPNGREAGSSEWQVVDKRADLGQGKNPGISTGIPRTAVRLPSEVNPWSTDTAAAARSTPGQVPRQASSGSANPWDREPTKPLTTKVEVDASKSLNGLSLYDKPAESAPVPAKRPQATSRKTDDEVKAALGEDQKAWDPLGVL